MGLNRRRPGPRRGARGSLAVAIPAALLLLVWIPPTFWTEELGRTARLALELGPWAWAHGPLLRDGLLAAVIAMGWVGIGGPAMRWLRGRPPGRGELVAGSFASGLGLAGMSIIGAGLLGMLTPAVIRWVFAVLGLAAPWGIRACWPGDRGRGAGSAPPGEGSPGGHWNVVWTILSIAPVPFLLADVQAPEGYWDAIVLHLGVPARWLDAGRVGNIAPFFQREPVLMCAHYAFASGLSGESLARWLNLVTGGALAVAVGALALRLGGGAGARPAGMAGFALVATGPMFALLSVHAGADIVTALFTVLAVSRFAGAWRRWPGGTAAPGALVAAGAFAGLAGACKLPGLGAIVVLVVLCAPRPRSALPLAAAATAAFLPWAARAWLLTGNPVYPLLDPLFPSPFWPPLSRDTYAAELSRTHGVIRPSDLIAGWIGGSEQQRATAVLAGPSAAIGAVVALGRAVRPGAPAVAIAFAAGLAGCWAVLAPAWRFYAGGLGVLAAVLGVLGADRRLRWIPLAACCVQVVRVPQVLDWADSPWAAARGEESRETYYARRHANPSFDAIASLDRHVRPRPGRRVLALGDVRTYLLPAHTLSVSYFEPEPLVAAARESVDARRLAVRMRQLGVRWLMLNVAESLRLRIWEGFGWAGDPPGRVLTPFFEGYTRLRYARLTAWVYEVAPNPSGAVLPECYRISGRDRPTALACASDVRARLVEHRYDAAMRSGWAAVAADEQSGLAWGALGDALFLAGRHEAAAGAYERALENGWRTSSVYRNLGAVLTRMSSWGRAREAMRHALSLDRDSPALAAELNEVWSGWWGEIRRGGPRGAGAGAR